MVSEVAGFSLHAGVATKTNERAKLERLCRYITRPAVSTKRLSITRNGRVRYELTALPVTWCTRVYWSMTPETSISHPKSWMPQMKIRRITCWGVRLLIALQWDRYKAVKYSPEGAYSWYPANFTRYWIRQFKHNHGGRSFRILAACRRSHQGQ